MKTENRCSTIYSKTKKSLQFQWAVQNIFRMTTFVLQQGLNPLIQALLYFLWVVFSHLAYFILFTLFPPLKNGFLTATLPCRAFLMRIQCTIDASTECPNPSFRSCVQITSYFFFKVITFWYCLSAVDYFFTPDASSFVRSSSSFLTFSQDTLHAILRHTNFSANSSLRITLLVQKYCFVSANLCYVLHFLELKKWEQTMCICHRLLVTKCWEITF